MMTLTAYPDGPRGPGLDKFVTALLVAIAVAALLACLTLVFGCTKAQRGLVLHVADVACEHVELVDTSGVGRVVCLTYEELRPLLDAVIESRATGKPLVVTLKTKDGEERFTVADLPKAEAEAMRARAVMESRR